MLWEWEDIIEPILNHISRFNQVKDDRKQTIQTIVALHECRYIFQIKEKTTKMLKCTKTLLTVKT